MHHEQATSLATVVRRDGRSLRVQPGIIPAPSNYRTARDDCDRSGRTVGIAQHIRPTPTASAMSCPSENVVENALGLTLSAPTSSPDNPAPPFPPGGSGINCVYLSGSQTAFPSGGRPPGAVVTLATNVAPSYFDTLKQLQAGGPIQLTTLSRLGDRAGYYQATYQSEPFTGVQAMKGTHLLWVEVDGLPSVSVARIVSLEAQLFASWPG